MRSLLWIALLLPAACAAPPAARAPSLRVGEAALGSGVPQVALAIAGRRLAADRDDVGALLMQGKALGEMGQPDKAVDSFRHAAALAPRRAEAHLGLGRGLLAAGQAAPAEAEFRRALEIDGGDARGLNDLGIALDLQDRHAPAQAAYRQALAASPELDAARVNLGLSLALAGDPRAGVELLRPLAANADAPARVRHDLAAALAIAGDRPGAERLLRQDLTPQQAATALNAYAELQAPGSPESAQAESAQPEPAQAATQGEGASQSAGQGWLSRSWSRRNRHSCAGARSPAKRCGTVHLARPGHHRPAGTLHAHA